MSKQRQLLIKSQADGEYDLCVSIVDKPNTNAEDTPNIDLVSNHGKEYDNALTAAWYSKSEYKK